MKLSRDRCVRLSQLVLNYLNQDEEVEFFDDLSEIRQQIFRLIESEMKADEAIPSISTRNE